MSNSLWPHGLWPARLLHPWDFPGKNTGVGCHALLQESFPTQGRTQLSYVSCIGRQVLYHHCHLGSPKSTVFQLKKKKNKTRTNKPWYHFCAKAAFILDCPIESCFSGKSVANLDVDANKLEYQVCVMLKKYLHWRISSSVGFQQYLSEKLPSDMRTFLYFNMMHLHTHRQFCIDFNCRKRKPGTVLKKGKSI